MKSVKLSFTTFYEGRGYGRELCVWTEETNYKYYPLSYSLRDCFELICEKLGWDYERYERTGISSGTIYAIKPKPKKRSMLEWWNVCDFTAASSTESCYTHSFNSDV